MTSKRSRAMSRLTTGLVCGVLATGVLAACGGDDDSDTATTPATTEATTETTPTETTETETTETGTATQEAAAAGKAVFTENCASCHTLADAGTSGTVGPNLDDLQPDAATVAAKVKAGGGGMPSFEGQLTSAQIAAVAAYVSSVAGK